jgi:hypothetical protein
VGPTEGPLRSLLLHVLPLLLVVLLRLLLL